MSLVECVWSEVLISRMDFKFIKGIYRSYGVLPNVADYVVEIASFEHVDRIGRHPKLHIDVAHWLVFPIRLVRFQLASDSVVLIFSRQSSVLACLLGPPFAEGSRLEIVHFSRPVPRHINLPIERPEFVVVSILPPENRKRRFDGSYPPLPLFTP